MTRSAVFSALRGEADVAQLLKSESPCDLTDEPSEACDRELGMFGDECSRDSDRIAAVGFLANKAADLLACRTTLLARRARI
jgi:hypothetical protein